MNYPRTLIRRTTCAVTTEALVFDRQRKSFTTFYNTCCGFNQIQVNPGQFIDVVGFSGQLLVEGRDRCTGVWQDTTTSASPTASQVISCAV